MFPWDITYFLNPLEFEPLLEAEKGEVGIPYRMGSGIRFDILFM